MSKLQNLRDEIIRDYLEHYSFPGGGEAHMRDCIDDCIERMKVHPQPCCRQFATCIRPCTPRGEWRAVQPWTSGLPESAYPFNHPAHGKVVRENSYNELREYAEKLAASQVQHPDPNSPAGRAIGPPSEGVAQRDKEAASDYEWDTHEPELDENLICVLCGNRFEHLVHGGKS